MAVEVKTLTIGSHVEYKGKRGRILYVSPGGDFMNCGIHTTDDCGLSANYHVSGFKQIHPIPITPALLKELGFENCAKKRWHTEDWEKRWGECQYLSFTKLYHGEWRVHYFDGAKDRGQAVVSYLHEAEAFLGLCNVELIKE